MQGVTYWYISLLIDSSFGYVIEKRLIEPLAPFHSGNDNQYAYSDRITVYFEWKCIDSFVWYVCSDSFDFNPTVLIHSASPGDSVDMYVDAFARSEFFYGSVCISQSIPSEASATKAFLSKCPSASARCHLYALPVEEKLQYCFVYVAFFFLQHNMSFMLSSVLFHFHL